MGCHSSLSMLELPMSLAPSLCILRWLRSTAGGGISLAITTICRHALRLKLLARELLAPAVTQQACKHNGCTSTCASVRSSFALSACHNRLGLYLPAERSVTWKVDSAKARFRAPDYITIRSHDTALDESFAADDKPITDRALS